MDSLAVKCVLVCAVLLILIDGTVPLRNCSEDREDDADDESFEPPPDFGVNLKKMLKGGGCGKDKQRKTYTKTKSKLNKGGVVQMDCGRCLLSHVHAKVSVGNEECPGLTPELTLSKLNCLWKNSCRLQYVPTNMFLPDMSSSCFFQVPDKIEVGYSCVDPRKTPITDVIPLMKVKATRGLVRSHDRSRSDKYPTGDLVLNKYFLSISAPEDLGASFVMIKILNYNLVDGDKLIVHTEGSSCSIYLPTNDPDHNITTHRLRVELTIRDDSPGSTGFAFCFQWFGSGDKDPDEKFSETVKSCRKYRNKAVEMDLKNDEFPVYDVVQIVTSKHESGIIRSHPYYPWNYQPIKVTDQLYELINRTSTSVFRKLVAPSGKFKKVRVTVKHVALGRRDRLELIPESGKSARFTARKNTDGSEYSFETESLLVNFTLKDRPRRRQNGQGFLLQYQWFDSNEGSKNVTFELQGRICEKLRKQAPRECKVKKRRNKKKRNKKKSKDGPQEPQAQEKETDKKKGDEKRRKGAKKGNERTNGGTKEGDAKQERRKKRKNKNKRKARMLKTTG